jgi:hypothetical protein
MLAFRTGIMFCRIKQTVYLAGFCARENIASRVFFLSLTFYAQKPTVFCNLGNTLAE